MCFHVKRNRLSGLYFSFHDNLNKNTTQVILGSLAFGRRPTIDHARSGRAVRTTEKPVSQFILNRNRTKIKFEFKRSQAIGLWQILIKLQDY